MAVYKDTKKFLTWLSKTVGNGWFAYEKVDLRSNTFLIETDDGDHYFTVWSRGDIRYKGMDRIQALVEFERGVKRNG